MQGTEDKERRCHMAKRLSQKKQGNRSDVPRTA